MSLLSEAQDRMPATARRKLGPNVQVGFFSPFRLPSLLFHSFFLFDFGNLTGCSFPVLVNASPVEWIANFRPNPVAGYVVPVVRPLLKSTCTKGSRSWFRIMVRSLLHPSPSVFQLSAMISTWFRRYNKLLLPKLWVRLGAIQSCHRRVRS